MRGRARVRGGVGRNGALGFISASVGVGEWLTFSGGVLPCCGGVAGGEAGSDGVVVVLWGMGQTVTPSRRLCPFIGKSHVWQWGGALLVDICEALVVGARARKLER